MKTSESQRRRIQRAITDIGYRLREIRLELGLTQREMAARLGCTLPRMQRLEAGQNLVVGTIVTIATTLKITPHSLLEPPKSDRSGDVDDHGAPEDRALTLEVVRRRDVTRSIMATPNSIKVAIDLSRGIAVQARGKPSNIVAFGAAATVVFVGAAVGVSAFNGGKVIVGGIKGLFGSKK